MKQKLLFLTLAVFGAACSSTPKTKFPDISKMIPQQVEKAPVKNKVLIPEWTTLASGAYQDESGNAVFYGLGLSNENKEALNSKTLSEDRARYELAKVLTSYMEHLVEDIKKTKPDSSIKNINKNRLNKSLEERTATIMMEAQITDRWLNPNNGNFYSRAKLDLNRFTDRLDKFDSFSLEDKFFLKKTIIQAHATMTGKMATHAVLSAKKIEVLEKRDRILSY